MEAYNQDILKEMKGVAEILTKSKHKQRYDLFPKFMKSVPAMDYNSDRFWELTDRLRKYYKNLSGNVVYACWELFRYELQQANSFCRCEAERKDVKKDIHELLTFVRGMEELKAALYEKLWEVLSGCSDDSYGDTVDSFWTHGREAVNEALEGKIEGCDYGKYYVGEEYWEMGLNDAVYKMLCNPTTIDRAFYD